MLNIFYGELPDSVEKQLTLGPVLVDFSFQVLDILPVFCADVDNALAQKRVLAPQFILSRILAP